MRSEEAGQGSGAARRWDRKYDAGEGPAHFRPNPLLTEHRHLLRGGRALDVACGFGGNAIYLAEHGYQVDAVDASGVALGRAQTEARGRGLQVGFVQADLERWWIPPQRYDLITMFHYLNRELTPRLVSGLRAGGLWFQAQRNVGFLDVRPGFNPAYLVQAGELALLAEQAGLEIVLHKDGSPEDATISALIARKPG